MISNYQAIAWISDHSDFDFGALQVRLKQRLPEARMSVQDKEITLSWGNWNIGLYLAEEASVEMEAQEFRKLLPDAPQSVEVARCRKRVQVWSADDTSDMAHFNNYIFVCEALESFSGVILFDPISIRYM